MFWVAIYMRGGIYAVDPNYVGIIDSKVPLLIVLVNYQFSIIKLTESIVMNINTSNDDF